jgi:DNA-binding NtrC family response regulator
MQKVLVVEPAESIAIPLRALLEQHGLEVDVVAVGDEVATRDLKNYAALVIDLKTGRDDAFAFLAELHFHHPHLSGRIVVMSATAAAEVIAALDALGVCGVVAKPLDAEEIVQAVLECLEHSPQHSVQ